MSAPRSVDVPGSDTSRGHTQISSRAMTRVVSAVAAEALGVTTGQVSVDLEESAGSLDVTVRAPLKAVPDEPGDAADTAGNDTTETRTEQAEQQVRDSVGELTGVPLGGVTVRLTKPLLRLPGQGD
ncbi:hypothetical protein [Cryobacterium sp. AP23]